MASNQQQSFLKKKKHERLLLVGAIVLIVCLGLFVFPSLSKKMLPTTAQVPEPTPQPVASENIMVFSPAIDERVSQYFQVRGKARVFENILSIRIKHKITGKIYRVDTTTAYASEVGTFGDFVYNASIEPDFSLRSGDELLLEVFQFSPKDGSEIDKVTIPLKFIPALH